MSEQGTTKDLLSPPVELTPEQMKRANDMADAMSHLRFNYRDAARIIIGLHDENARLQNILDTLELGS